MLRLCEKVMRDVCEDFGAVLVECNGQHDHVHLLIKYPPKVAVSALVNSLKGVSSRRLRQDFTGKVNRASIHGRNNAARIKPPRMRRLASAHLRPHAAKLAQGTGARASRCGKRR
jgi:REP element-mobilizing transposase RayT